MGGRQRPHDREERITDNIGRQNGNHEYSFRHRITRLVGETPVLKKEIPAIEFQKETIGNKPEFETEYVCLFVLMKLKVPVAFFDNVPIHNMGDVLKRKNLVREKVCGKIRELNDVEIKFSNVFT